MSPLAIKGWTLFQTLLFLCSPFVAAVNYGENHAPVEKDEELVAANFPNTNETLFSPAFADLGSVLPGFANGTDGPTDDATLGMYPRTEA